VPSITVTISASYTTSWDSIVGWHAITDRLRTAAESERSPRNQGCEVMWWTALSTVLLTIGLSALDMGFHASWRHETGVTTQIEQLTRPMELCRTTGSLLAKISTRRRHLDA